MFSNIRNFDRKSSGTPGCLHACLKACLCLILLVNAWGVSAQTDAALELLWRDGESGALVGKVFEENSRERSGALLPAQVPLGSLWKLFVYAYLIEVDTPAPDYVCQARADDAKLREEELYCCDPGQGIARDAALVASCGPFFDPARLKISAAQWRDFWTKAENAPDWLADLAAMRPETLVPPASIIQALETVPKRAREQASGVLLARVLDTGDDTRAVGHLGGRLRIKTFSWFRPGTDKRYGGGAGWLTDGTPVWFAGNGTGQQVMAKQAVTLGENLPLTRSKLVPGCVDVAFFTRYPIRHIQGPDGAIASPGVLFGRHVAVFENNVSLPFSSAGELTLTETDGRPVVRGRFGVDEYVARVVEREGKATETQAARALAVIVRTYLFENAHADGNCLFIEDSSRYQRVSPNPPSAEGWKVAAFTSDLVLDGPPVGYHSTRADRNRMSWQDAVERSQNGQRWDVILAQTLPASHLAAQGDPAGIGCERLPQAEQWLAEQSMRWRSRLHALQGFEPPESAVVCRLQRGNPFSELDRGRIHVRGLRTQEDRLSLAHEYIHLGLRHHPASTDEKLVESWARRLIVGDS